MKTNMNFTTPCFVYVPSDNERKNLIKWLKSIGYKIAKHLWGDYVVVNREEAYCPLAVYNSALINCGLDVWLFRALAAMNDENDREQWFVVKKNISDFYDIDDVVYHKGDMFFNKSGEPLLDKYFRKATAEEILAKSRNRVYRVGSVRP